MVDLLNLLQLHGAFAVRASRPGRAVRVRDELRGMKIVFFFLEKQYTAGRWGAAG